MKLTKSYNKALEDKAESILISLIDNLEKLFEGAEEYSEKRERHAERMIIGVINYLDKLFDDEQQQAESA